MTRTGMRRILLVGFMASGKSTVGPLLAGALGWTFHDFDAAVEAEEGRSVPRIFAESGESRFRALEDRVARRLLEQDEVVLGSGGGWAAQDDRLRTVPEGTVSIWLRVSAEEAVRRAGAAPGSRPLLGGADPLTDARRLLERRQEAYAACDIAVDTDGRTAKDVAARILGILGRSPANHTTVGM